MIKIQFRKKVYASLLALALSLSNGALLAEAKTPEKQNALFEPIYGIVDSKKVPFDDNEKVNLIIEFDGNPLLENRKQIKQYNSINDFFNANDTKTMQRKLEMQRKTMISKLKKKCVDLQVEYEYSTILNGIAVKSTYKELENIRKMAGVKNVYISKKYNKIVPVSYQPYMADSTDGNEVTSHTPYSGKGTMIAILDDGMEVTHSAFQGEVHEPKYQKSDIEYCLKNKPNNIPTTVSIDEIYHSTKIPFAYDYADGDSNVTGGNHGIHVSGIATANNGEICGVAPDAQLAFMKIFSDDGSADEIDIFAALEDAIELGADVINMSLGSTAGFTDESGLRSTVDVYRRVVDAGIGIMVAAGNEGTSSYQYDKENPINNLSFATNPDNGTVGSPSTYPETVSVASATANSSNVNSTYMTVGGNTIEYIEVENTSSQFSSLVGTKEYTDYDSLLNKSEVNGKIALMNGERILSNEIEIKNGLIQQMEESQQNGAIGIILYLESKTTDEELKQVLPILEQPFQLPVIAISAQSGQYMFDNPEKKVKIVVEEQNKTMSNFSSWGVTPDLKLKPEITALGGKIKSSISNNQYATMSGTSMASPYIAGCFAVLKEYLHNIPMTNAMNVYEKEEFMNTLMMCTAKPLVDPSTGTFYSPRQQGAGIVQLDKAMETKGYLTMAEQKRPKAELGYQENGEFQFSFDVHNMSSNEITYQVEVTALTESTTLDSNGQKRIAQHSLKLDENEVVINIGKEITVLGNTKQTIPVSISLTEMGKARLNEDFPNGIFVDGYVILTPIVGDVATLSIPFVGYYGDWNNPPIFDGTVFDEEGLISLYPSEIYVITEESAPWGIEAGTNLYIEGVPRQKKFIAIKGDGTERVVPILTLLRGAKSIHQKLEKNGVSIYEEEGQKVYKSYYDIYYDQFMQFVPESHFEFHGYQETGNIDGKYTYKIEAMVDGVLDKTQTMEFPVVIDSEEPNVLKKDILENTEDTYEIKLTVQDNHYIQAVCLAGGNGRITEWKMPEEEEEGVMSQLSFSIERGNDLQTVAVALVDYAGNSRVVALSDVPTHIENGDMTNQGGGNSSQVGGENQSGGNSSQVGGENQGGGNSSQVGGENQGGGNNTQAGNGNVPVGGGFPLGGMGGAVQGGVVANLSGDENATKPEQDGKSKDNTNNATTSNSKNKNENNAKKSKNTNASKRKEVTYKELVAAYKKSVTSYQKVKTSYLKEKKKFVAAKRKFKGDTKNKKYILQKQKYLKAKKQYELRKKEMNVAKKAVEKKKAEMKKSGSNSKN